VEDVPDVALATSSVVCRDAGSVFGDTMGDASFCDTMADGVC